MQIEVIQFARGTTNKSEEFAEGPVIGGTEDEEKRKSKPGNTDANRDTERRVGKPYTHNPPPARLAWVILPWGPHRIFTIKLPSAARD